MVFKDLFGMRTLFLSISIVLLINCNWWLLLSQNVAHLLRIFFDYVTLIMSSTCASCKRKDLLLDKHRLNLLAKLESEQINSGKAKQ
jgi:hypothetical protein